MKITAKTKFSLTMSKVGAFSRKYQITALYYQKLGKEGKIYVRWESKRISWTKKSNLKYRVIYMKIKVN